LLRIRPQNSSGIIQAQFYFCKGKDIKKTSLLKLVGELLIAAGAFLLHQLWAQKQGPWLAALMASPAAQVILSRVVVFAQKGSADRFGNNLPQCLWGEVQLERY
jgi:hypothetical protein